MHCLPQTAKETEDNKKEETEDYLKTTFWYFSEKIKSINKIEYEELKTYLLKTHEGMIVDDKLIFEEWVTDDKFASENVTTSIARLTLTTCLKNPTWFQKTETLAEPLVSLRGCSYGSELARLGGLADLGGISPFLRNSFKKLSMFIWEVSQPT